MGPVVAVDGSYEAKLEENPGISALPNSTEDTWKKSPLGPPEKWHDTLRTFAHFITTLPHPAAVFWYDDLVQIHNHAWKEAAGGDGRQGEPYKSLLAEEALSMLRTTMLGRSRQSLQAELFLNNESQDGVQYQALLSPVMQDSKMAPGVVVQLSPLSYGQKKQRSEQRGVLERVQHALTAKEDQADGQQAIENLPLDENPFFQRFASMLPTGMAILNHNAEAVFVNEQFFELTSSVGGHFRAWPQSIHPDDYDRVMTAYREIFKGPGKTLRMEFRTMGENDNWRLLMVSPLGDGHMRDESIEKYGGFVCAVIDISPNKAQELAQKKAAEEALERKEQQERFIDMISHEIRNPLSAILHCAEEILEVIGDDRGKSDASAKFNVSSITESAETIKLCVAHQKNIVDDILSFSKLDASMLSLCPRSVQPRRQLADSLRMFQPEMKKQHIELEYKIDTSFEEHYVDWVKADLVRISQVLVNLVSNAIKFTARKDGQKKITTMIGASERRPTSYPPNVVFFESKDLGFRMDGTNTSEWGNGEALYLMVAVKDTGIGISDENQKKLFQRFRQATPKTEESYGGSGLGLMISRKLCQLHGGEIGVSSIEGSGSTFGFFFRVRRAQHGSEPPPEREQVSTQALMDKMHDAAKGHAPIASTSEGSANGSLENPKVENTSEAGQHAKGDEKWHNTAAIASQVDERKGDEYGQNIRPSGPTRTASTSSPSFKDGMKKVPTTLERMQRRTDNDLAAKKIDEEHSSRPRSPDAKQDRAHILLVEDNVINQRILRRKLESKEFKVTTANNGQEAIEAVKSRAGTTMEGADTSLFDVVLMDQEMPVLDGNGATQEIRRLETRGEVKHLPILGVTANVRDQQRADMVSAGMDDVISKPYSIGDLIGKIEGLLKFNGIPRTEKDPVARGVQEQGQEQEQEQEQENARPENKNIEGSMEGGKPKAEEMHGEVGKSERTSGEGE